MLKYDSINSYRAWVENGKPHSGLLFEKKCKAKFEYKLGLKKHRNEESTSVSNNLHDALIKKDNMTFWKMWKNKFGVKNLFPCPSMDPVTLKQLQILLLTILKGVVKLGQVNMKSSMSYLRIV